MSTQATDIDPRIEDKHPIDEDIVKRIACRASIGLDLLHEVLAACDAVWEPYREYLEDVLYGCERGRKFAVRYTEDENRDVFLVSGPGLRPTDMVRRIHYREMITVANSTVTPVELCIAVSVAHERQAERLDCSGEEYPLVINRV